MGRRSFVVDLPAEVKAWLDNELVKRGFADYEELADSLKSKGIDTSKSALGRYGQKLQREIEAIRASTEAAKQIANATPDEADARSAAVISLFQSRMFDAMLELGDIDQELDPASRIHLLGKSARGLASLTQASIRQKKWAAEVQTKLNAAKATAAKNAEAIARKAGVSDEDWGEIRAEILGIEVDA